MLVDILEGTNTSSTVSQVNVLSEAQLISAELEFPGCDQVYEKAMTYLEHFHFNQARNE